MSRGRDRRRQDRRHQDRRHQDRRHHKQAHAGPTELPPAERRAPVEGSVDRVDRDPVLGEALADGSYRVTPWSRRPDGS